MFSHKDKSSDVLHSIEAVAVPPKTLSEEIIDLFRFAIIALIIVLPIRYFIAQPFVVSGASMDDTFQDGQYLIVDQVSYYFEEPERGDVIIFRYPLEPSKHFIKRIIGIPGDTIVIEDGAVTIKNDEFPDGITIDEPYAQPITRDTRLQTTLTEDEYFVMGDNRDHSSDSRSWGVLPEENITGRALLRLWPLRDYDVSPGAYNISKTLNAKQ